MRAKAGGWTNSFGGVNPVGANAAGDTKPTPNVAAAATDSPPTDNAGDEPVAVGELEAFLDNLANVAKAEWSSLEELVKSLATLTTTNSELVAANKKLANEHANLQHEINGLRKRGGAPKGNANKYFWAATQSLQALWIEEPRPRGMLRATAERVKAPVGIGEQVVTGWGS